MSDNLYTRTYRDALTGPANTPVVFTTNTNNNIEDGSSQRIMAKVRELGLALKLDARTRGDGACFFWAVLQQLRRKEIYPTLSPDLRHLVDTNNALVLRQKICQFSLKSPLVRAELKDHTENKPWDRYWTDMLKHHKWTDGAVLRTTALYIGMSISLVDTEISNKIEPFLTLSPTFDKSGVQPRSALFIGLDHDLHFQSLLPSNKNTVKMQPAGDNKSMASTSSAILPNTGLPLTPIPAPTSSANSGQNEAKDGSLGYKTMTLSLGMTSKEKQIPPKDSEDKAKTSGQNEAQDVSLGYKTMTSSLGMTSKEKQIPPKDSVAPQLSSSSSSSGGSDLPTECPACHGHFPKLMAHLRNKVCKEKLGEQAIDELRLRFRKQSIVKYNKTDKAAECQKRRNKRTTMQQRGKKGVSRLSNN